jgi:hypothetical protein
MPIGFQPTLVVLSGGRYRTIGCILKVDSPAPPEAVGAGPTFMGFLPRRDLGSLPLKPPDLRTVPVWMLWFRFSRRNRPPTNVRQNFVGNLLQPTPLDHFSELGWFVVVDAFFLLIDLLAVSEHISLAETWRCHSVLDFQEGTRRQEGTALLLVGSARHRLAWPLHSTTLDAKKKPSPRRQTSVPRNGSPQ